MGQRRSILSNRRVLLGTYPEFSDSLLLGGWVHNLTTQVLGKPAHGEGSGSNPALRCPSPLPLVVELLGWCKPHLVQSTAWRSPEAVSLYPTTCPRSLMSRATLSSPPKVPRSVIEYAADAGFAR